MRDGEAALDYLYCRGAFAKREPVLPAALLLDNKMPRVSGLEVLDTVRADPDFRYLPVVMLTSSREESDVLSSYRRGVNAYVVKPVEAPAFLEAVTWIGLFWAVLNVDPASAPGTGSPFRTRK